VEKKKEQVKPSGGFILPRDEAIDNFADIMKFQYGDAEESDAAFKRLQGSIEVCPNDGAKMMIFKEPISVLQMFDPNLLEGCDWEGWEEGKLGWLLGVCPECNFFVGRSPPDEEAIEDG